MKMHLALMDWYGLVVDIRLFVFWAPTFDNWWFIDYLYTFMVWLLWGMVMVSALKTWGDFKDRAHLYIYAIQVLDIWTKLRFTQSFKEHTL